MDDRTFLAIPSPPPKSDMGNDLKHNPAAGEYDGANDDAFGGGGCGVGAGNGFANSSQPIATIDDDDPFEPPSPFPFAIAIDAYLRFQSAVQGLREELGERNALHTLLGEPIPTERRPGTKKKRSESYHHCHRHHHHDDYDNRTHNRCRSSHHQRQSEDDAVERAAAVRGHHHSSDRHGGDDNNDRHAFGDASSSPLYRGRPNNGSSRSIRRKGRDSRCHLHVVPSPSRPSSFSSRHTASQAAAAAVTAMPTTLPSPITSTTTMAHVPRVTKSEQIAAARLSKAGANILFGLGYGGCGYGGVTEALTDHMAANNFNNTNFSNNKGGFGVMKEVGGGFGGFGGDLLLSDGDDGVGDDSSSVCLDPFASVPFVFPSNSEHDIVIDPAVRTTSTSAAAATPKVSAAAAAMVGEGNNANTNNTDVGGDGRRSSPLLPLVPAPTSNTADADDFDDDGGGVPTDSSTAATAVTPKRSESSAASSPPQQQRIVPNRATNLYQRPQSGSESFKSGGAHNATTGSSHSNHVVSAGTPNSKNTNANTHADASPISTHMAHPPQHHLASFPNLLHSHHHNSGGGGGGPSSMMAMMGQRHTSNVTNNSSSHATNYHSAAAPSSRGPLPSAGAGGVTAATASSAGPSLHHHFGTTPSSTLISDLQLVLNCNFMSVGPSPQPSQLQQSVNTSSNSVRKQKSRTPSIVAMGGGGVGAGGGMGVAAGNGSGTPMTNTIASISAGASPSEHGLSGRGGAFLMGVGSGGGATAPAAFAHPPLHPNLSQQQQQARVSGTGSSGAALNQHQNATHHQHLQHRQQHRYSDAADLSRSSNNKKSNQKNNKSNRNLLRRLMMEGGVADLSILSATSIGGTSSEEETPPAIAKAAAVRPEGAVAPHATHAHEATTQQAAGAAGAVTETMTMTDYPIIISSSSSPRQHPHASVEGRSAADETRGGAGGSLMATTATSSEMLAVTPPTTTLTAAGSNDTATTTTTTASHSNRHTDSTSSTSASPPTMMRMGSSSVRGHGSGSEEAMNTTFGAAAVAAAAAAGASISNRLGLSSNDKSSTVMGVSDATPLFLGQFFLDGEGGNNNATSDRTTAVMGLDAGSNSNQQQVNSSPLFMNMNNKQQHAPFLFSSSQEGPATSLPFASGAGDSTMAAAGSGLMMMGGGGGEGEGGVIERLGSMSSSAPLPMLELIATPEEEGEEEENDNAAAGNHAGEDGGVGFPSNPLVAAGGFLSGKEAMAAAVMRAGLIMEASEESRALKKLRGFLVTLEMYCCNNRTVMAMAGEGGGDPVDADDSGIFARGLRVDDDDDDGALACVIGAAMRGEKNSDATDNARSDGGGAAFSNGQQHQQLNSARENGNGNGGQIHNSDDAFEDNVIVAEGDAGEEGAKAKAKERQRQRQRQRERQREVEVEALVEWRDGLLAAAHATVDSPSLFSIVRFSIEAASAPYHHHHRQQHDSEEDRRGGKGEVKNRRQQAPSAVLSSSHCGEAALTTTPTSAADDHYHFHRLKTALISWCDASIETAALNIPNRKAVSCCLRSGGGRGEEEEEDNASLSLSLSSRSSHSATTRTWLGSSTAFSSSSLSFASRSSSARFLNNFYNEQRNHIQNHFGLVRSPNTQMAGREGQGRQKGEEAATTLTASSSFDAEKRRLSGASAAFAAAVIPSAQVQSYHQQQEACGGWGEASSAPPLAAAVTDAGEGLEGDASSAKERKGAAAGNNDDNDGGGGNCGIVSYRHYEESNAILLLDEITGGTVTATTASAFLAASPPFACLSGVAVDQDGVEGMGSRSALIIASPPISLAPISAPALNHTSREGATVVGSLIRKEGEGEEGAEKPSHDNTNTTTATHTNTNSSSTAHLYDFPAPTIFDDPFGKSMSLTTTGSSATHTSSAGGGVFPAAGMVGGVMTRACSRGGVGGGVGAFGADEDAGSPLTPPAPPFGQLNGPSTLMSPPITTAAGGGGGGGGWGGGVGGLAKPPLSLPPLSPPPSSSPLSAATSHTVFLLGTTSQIGGSTPLFSYSSNMLPSSQQAQLNSNSKQSNSSGSGSTAAPLPTAVSPSASAGERDEVVVAREEEWSTSPPCRHQPKTSENENHSNTDQPKPSKADGTMQMFSSQHHHHHQHHHQHQQNRRRRRRTPSPLHQTDLVRILRGILLFDTLPTAKQCRHILQQVRDYMRLNECNIVTLKGPCVAIGDIHGNMNALRGIFAIIADWEMMTSPPPSSAVGHNNRSLRGENNNNTTASHLTRREQKGEAEEGVKAKTKVSGASIPTKSGLAELLSESWAHVDKDKPVNAPAPHSSVSPPAAAVPCLPKLNHRILFLGDYVDRGSSSLHCALAVCCAKLLYPTDVFMIRGNHECKDVNGTYGFLAEVEAAYPHPTPREETNNKKAERRKMKKAGNIQRCDSPLSEKNTNGGAAGIGIGGGIHLSADLVETEEETSQSESSEEDSIRLLFSNGGLVSEPSQSCAAPSSSTADGTSSSASFGGAADRSAMMIGSGSVGGFGGVSFNAHMLKSLRDEMQASMGSVPTATSKVFLPEVGVSGGVGGGASPLNPSQHLSNQRQQSDLLFLQNSLTNHPHFSGDGSGGGGANPPPSHPPPPHSHTDLISSAMISSPVKASADKKWSDVNVGLGVSRKVGGGSSGGRGGFGSGGASILLGSSGVGEAPSENPTWALFNDMFLAVPIAAIINNTIFCVHGGLGPSFSCAEELLAMDRFLVGDCDLISDVLWSDPCSHMGFASNRRGNGCLFGPDVTQQFLARNNFSWVLRAHQCPKKGFEALHDDTLVTLFSSSNYCGMGNDGAIAFIGGEEEGKDRKRGGGRRLADDHADEDEDGLEAEQQSNAVTSPNHSNKPFSGRFGSHRSSVWMGSSPRSNSPNDNDDGDPFGGGWRVEGRHNPTPQKSQCSSGGCDDNDDDDEDNDANRIISDGMSRTVLFPSRSDGAVLRNSSANNTMKSNRGSKAFYDNADPFVSMARIEQQRTSSCATAATAVSGSNINARSGGSGSRRGGGGGGGGVRPVTEHVCFVSFTDEAIKKRAERLLLRRDGGSGGDAGEGEGGTTTVRSDANGDERPNHIPTVPAPDARRLPIHFH